MQHVHIVVLHMPKQVRQCTSTITHLPSHINTSRELFQNQLTGLITSGLDHGIFAMVKNISKVRFDHTLSHIQDFRGRVPMQVPCTSRNYTLELPTLGIIAGVNPVEVQ